MTSMKMGKFFNYVQEGIMQRNLQGGMYVDIERREVYRMVTPTGVVVYRGRYHDIARLLVNIFGRP